MVRIDHAAVVAAELDDWRPLVHRLHARYRTGDFAAGLEFLVDVGAAAEEANHHPDVRLGYTHVEITLTSHDVGGLTERDLELARTVTDLAAARGLTAEPASVTCVEVALNAASQDALGPFWAAVLTGDAGAYADGEVVDPTGQTPLLWFQQTDPREEVPPMCFHLDVWVPPDQLDARIATTVAAGGRVVHDSESPSFVVLEDAEGNKACLCTAADRS